MHSVRGHTPSFRGGGGGGGESRVCEREKREPDSVYAYWGNRHLIHFGKLDTATYELRHSQKLVLGNCSVIVCGATGTQVS